MSMVHLKFRKQVLIKNNFSLFLIYQNILLLFVFYQYDNNIIGVKGRILAANL
jgi:hypothetical protein